MRYLNPDHQYHLHQLWTPRRLNYNTDHGDPVYLAYLKPTHESPIILTPDQFQLQEGDTLPVDPVLDTPEHLVVRLAHLSLSRRAWRSYAQAFELESEAVIDLAQDLLNYTYDHG